MYRDTTTKNHRSRWAAIGAAIAVSLGAGGVGIVGATTSPDGASTFVGTDPCRLLDTRAGEFHIGPDGTIGPDSKISITARGDVGECSGATSLPSDASGLQLNVTPIDATEFTNIRLYPGPGDPPNASNLNPTPGAPPIPNAVTVRLDDDGVFSIYNRFGSVDVAVDVVGYFTGNFEITGDEVTDGSLTGDDLANDSVNSDKVADGSIMGPDLANDSVDGSKVADGTLTGDDVADESLAGADIADGTVMGPDLANDSVNSDKVEDESLTGADVDDNSLSKADISDEAGLSYNATVHPFTGIALEPNPTDTVVGTVELRVPADGFVTVQADVTWNEVTAAGDVARCQIVKAGTDYDNSEPFFRLNDFGGQVTGWATTSSHRTFEVTPADNPVFIGGGVEFNVVCNELSGGVTIPAVYMTAQYVSTDRSPFTIIIPPFPVQSAEE